MTFSSVIKNSISSYSQESQFFGERNSNITFLGRSLLYSYVIYRGVCGTSFNWGGLYFRKDINIFFQIFCPWGITDKIRGGGGQKKMITSKTEIFLPPMPTWVFFLLGAETYYFEFHQGHTHLMSNFWTRLWWYILYN